MMNIPDDLKYTKEHEWVKVQGDIAVIGITDFAQHQLTDVVFVELPKKGKQAEAGKSIATLESVKSVSDVFSPLSGEVIEANEELSSSPEMINADCYGKAWIAKIRIKNKAELPALMSAQDYGNFIAGK